MADWFEDLDKFLKEESEAYAKLNPPDFVTHYNYIEYLASLSKMSLNYKPSVNSKIIKSQNIGKKIILIKLTLENIQQEYETIKKNPDFAIVCVCWIPVKSYYMLFNLLMILRYLITGQENSFNISHVQLLKEMIDYLDRGELIFSQVKFNTIHNGKVAFDWTSPDKGNHLKAEYDPETLYLQIIKKLQTYKEDDYRMKNNIKTLRSKANRDKIENFRTNSKIGLFEFFYWYRIKANYRDLEFLDKEINTSKFVDYYINYHDLTINVFKSIKNLINELSIIRFGEEVIKLDC